MRQQHGIDGHGGKSFSSDGLKSRRCGKRRVPLLFDVAPRPAAGGTNNGDDIGAAWWFPAEKAFHQ